MQSDEMSNNNQDVELQESINFSNNLNDNFLDIKKNSIEDDYSSESNFENDPRYFLSRKDDDKLKDESTNKKISFKTDTKTSKEKKDKEEKVNDENKSLNVEICITNEDQTEITENRPMPPIQYTYDKIKDEIFPKFKEKNINTDKFKKNDNLLNLEKSISDKTFLGKKTRKEKKHRSIKPKEKQGRKKNEDILGKKNSKHNKYSQDNIIKKIKVKLLDYLIDFINSILNFVLEDKIISYLKIVKKNETEKTLRKENLIKDLNYKNIIDIGKKGKNLEFFGITLKEFLSNDISIKFKTFPKDSNKKIIEEILNKEKDNQIINFIFKLTFRQWLDVFLYKKELNDYINLDKSKIKIIMDKFKRFDELLKDIYSEPDNFISCYICCLFNIERWYFIKKERTIKIKNKNLNNIIQIENI